MIKGKIFPSTAVTCPFCDYTEIYDPDCDNIDYEGNLIINCSNCGETYYIDYDEIVVNNE